MPKYTLNVKAIVESVYRGVKGNRKSQQQGDKDAVRAADRYNKELQKQAKATNQVAAAEAKVNRERAKTRKATTSGASKELDRDARSLRQYIRGQKKFYKDKARAHKEGLKEEQRASRAAEQAADRDRKAQQRQIKSTVKDNLQNTRAARDARRGVGAFNDPRQFERTGRRVPTFQSSAAGLAQVEKQNLARALGAAKEQKQFYDNRNRMGKRILRDFDKQERRIAGAQRKLADQVTKQARQQRGRQVQAHREGRAAFAHNLEQARIRNRVHENIRASREARGARTAADPDNRQARKANEALRAATNQQIRSARRDVGAAQELLAAKIRAAGGINKVDNVYKRMARSAVRNDVAQRKAARAAEEYAAKQRSQITGQQPTLFQRLQSKISQRQGGGFQDPTQFQTGKQFFTSKALTSAGFALSGFALYGAVAGVRSLIEESEELQVSFNKIEAQLISINDPRNYGTVEDQFKAVKRAVLDIAAETGVAADEVAQVAFQFQGAFGDTDTAIRETEAAMKGVAITGLEIREVVDSLTAIRITFDDGGSIDDIFDKVVGLEERFGVLAKETVTFVADLAPVADQAGLDKDETAVLGAAFQRSSGKSGTHGAEQLGRALPGILKLQAEIEQIYESIPALAGELPVLREMFASGESGQVLLQIIRDIADTNNEITDKQVNQLANLIGQRRETQTINALFSERNAIVEELNANGGDGFDDAGKAAQRFAKLTETMRLNFKQFGEELKQLGVKIFESGLGEALSTMADIGKIVVQVFGGVLNVMGGLNQALGGIPGQILALAAAGKILAAVFGLKMLAGVRAAVAGKVQFIKTTGLAASVSTKNTAAVTKEAYAYRLQGYSAAGASFPKGRAAVNAGFAGIGHAGQGLTKSQLVGGGAALAGLVGLTTLLQAASDHVDDLEAANQELDEKLRALPRDEILDYEIQEPGGHEGRVIDYFFDGLDFISGKDGGDDLGYRLQSGIAKISPFHDEADLPLHPADVRTIAANRALSEGGASRIGAVLDSQDADLQDRTFAGISDGEKAALKAQLVEAWGEKYGDAVKSLNIDEILDDPQLLREVISSAETGEEAQGRGSDANAQLLYLLDAHLFDDNGTTKRRADLAAAGTSVLDDTIQSFDTAQKEFERGNLRRHEFNDALEKHRETLLNQKKANEEDPLELERINNELAELAESEEQRAGDLARHMAERQRIAQEAAGVPAEIAALNALNTQISSPDLTDSQRYELLPDLIEAERAAWNRELSEIKSSREAAERAAEGFSISPEARSLFVEEQLELSDPFQRALEDFARYLEINSEGSLENLETSLASTIAGGANVQEAVIIEAASRALGVEDTEGFAADVLAASKENNESVREVLIRMLEEEKRRLQAIVDGILNDPNATESELYGTTGIQAEIDRIDEVLSTNSKDLEEKFSGVEDPQRLVEEGKATQEEVDAWLKKARDEAFALQNAWLDLFAAAAGNDPIAQADIQIARAYAAVAAAEADLEAGDITQEQFDATKLGAEAQIVTAERNRNNAFHEVHKTRLELGKVLTKNPIKQNDIDLQIAQLDRAKAVQENNIVALAQADLRIASLMQQRNEISFQLQKFPLEMQQALAQNPLAQAQASLQGYQYDLAVAQALDDPVAQNQAIIGINQSYQQIADYQNSITQAQLDARATLATDPIAAAQAQQTAAQFQLAVAQSKGDVVGQIQAQTAISQAAQALADANHDLHIANLQLEQQRASFDPVRAAQIGLEIARAELKNAKGAAEKAKAQAAVLAAEKQVAQAQMQVFQAQQNILIASAQATGDAVAVAQLQLEALRQQLKKLKQMGHDANSPELLALQAEIITAQAAVRDARFNDQLGDIEFLLEMERITTGQAISMMESLAKIPGLTEEQLRTIQRRIKQLQGELKSDFQFNLPTTLGLTPTLFEARRIDQAAPGGVQDNRQINATFIINNGMDEEEAAAFLNEAVGSGRLGVRPRRY